MTTQEVAAKLVQYCREGKNMDAINELYADDIVSREPKGSATELVEGKDGVLQKNQHWYNMVQEIHSGVVSDPIVTGNFFAVTMDMDVTYKEHGRMAMHEIAVYEVKDGQIIADQFFYNM
ncbi:MAG: nuclear transport factor 2 family protein [Bacteroidota bacterium]